MSYGVKYKIEFDDVNLKGKKIEICKKNYSATVFDIVGTADICEIEYTGDDNFYNPIIGSTCNLNLYETDDFDYDEFYAFDEREYQVKVYYKDTSNNYQIYWIGWLLVDRFKEVVMPNPKVFSLTAYDGLGSLEGFDMPIDLTTTAQKSLLYQIHNILGYINLGLDIYISNDIRKSGAPASKYTIYDQVDVTAFQFMNNFDLPNAKENLEQILKFTNARIFQSYGRWYIINNSSYSEQSVKTSSESTAEGGNVPTGIRASETTSLQNNSTESIKYHIYNSSGVYQSTSTVDVLNIVPSDLQPINANLTKEYLSPLKEFSITRDTSQMNEVNIISNSGFEHGTSQWTFTNSNLNTTIVKEGLRSAENAQYQANETGTAVAIAQTSSQAQATHLAYKLKINVYLNSSFTGDRSFRWQLKFDATVVPGGSGVRYWNTSNNQWVASAHANIQSIEQNQKWLSFTYNIDSFPLATGDMTLSLYAHYQASSSSNPSPSIIYDNITMDFERIDSNDVRTPFFAPIDNYVSVRARTTDFSNVLELKDLKLRSDKYSNVSGDFYRSRDDNASFVTSVEKIITQQVMNDYRTNVVRYEGDLYNNNNDPISLHNKVWINFGTTILQEPVSCYIDSMTYNVVKNTYSVVMHIPNQDDDITTTFSDRF